MNCLAVAATLSLAPPPINVIEFGDQQRNNLLKKASPTSVATQKGGKTARQVPRTDGPLGPVG